MQSRRSRNILGCTMSIFETLELLKRKAPEKQIPKEEHESNPTRRTQ